jgi:hypothetical protein
MTTKYTPGQPSEGHAHGLLTHAMAKALALTVLVRQLADSTDGDARLVALANLAAREAEALCADLDHVDDVWQGNVAMHAA